MGQGQSSRLQPRVSPHVPILLALAVCVGVCSAVTARPRGPAAAQEKTSRAGDELSRKHLDQLVGEQKFEEAAAEAARIREAARRGDNDASGPGR